MLSHKENELKLQIYPMNENEYIGTIRINEKVDSCLINTVIILDQSISMRDATKRFTNEIIPLILSKLSYSTSQPVHLLTFAKDTQHFSVTPNEMKLLDIKTYYGTKMAPTVQKVHYLFQSFQEKLPIRVLTISDGEVQDREDTENAATDLMEFIDSSNFSINSQAVRLFTSKCQPDTKALCTFLRMNNTTTSQLIDISARESNENIATKIADLFQSDNLSKSEFLAVEDQILMKFPWTPKASSEIMLVPGLNVFWLKNIPKDGIRIRNSPVKIIMKNPLSLHKFQHLIEPKLVYIVDHMKILQIVGTVDAKKNVDQMLNYFQTRENELSQKFSICNYFNINSTSQKNISILLADIANDENFNNLDSVQIAEYLREFSKKQLQNTNLLERFIKRIRNFGITFNYIILICVIVFGIIAYKFQMHTV